MKYLSGYESIYSKTILWIVVLLAYCIFIRKVWHAYYMNIDEEICPGCDKRTIPKPIVSLKVEDV